MLEIRLLGEFDVRLDGEPIEIPSRPSQSLLAYLVMTAGTRHRREKLAGLLWPDSEEVNARSNLRHALWRLRKSLKKGYFQADKVSIHFEPESEYQLDVKELEDLSEKSGSIEAQKRTLSVYGGELLPGFYDGWVQLERERLRAVFEAQIQRFLDDLIQQASWPEVLEWGERWIALGQVPEPAFRALMIAHSGMGDTAGMAGDYQRCVESLREELGVEPSEQTRETYESLSSGEVPQALEAVSEMTVSVGVSAETAIETLLDTWQKRGVDVLDLPSLSIVYAARVDQHFESEDAELLIRSALHHGVDVEHWVESASSSKVAVEALTGILDTYPKPRIRMRIVEALEQIGTEEANQALLLLAGSDDSPSVRAEAAVAYAHKGDLGRLLPRILSDFGGEQEPAAMTALIAVADEVGIPATVDGYPKTRVNLAVIGRRWKKHRADIFRRAIRAIQLLIVPITLHGLAFPLYMAVGSRSLFDAFLTDQSTILAWSLSAAAAMVIMGGVQGLVSTYLVSFADVVWGPSNRNGRYILGGISGLIHSQYLIVFSYTGLLAPEVPAALFLPVYVVYGILLGVAIAMALPVMEEDPPTAIRLRRSLIAGGLISLLTMPYVYLTSPREFGGLILSRLMFAFILVLVLGMWLKDPGQVIERETQDPAVTASYIGGGGEQ